MVENFAGFFHRAQRRLAGYRVVNLHDLYKVWEQEHLKKLLSHYAVDCVFDVGANDGQYAEMLRSKVNFKGKIISFEPMPESAALLRSKTGGHSDWSIEELALAAADGEQDFNVMKNTQFSSLSAPRHDEVKSFSGQNKVSQTITVKTETLATAYERLIALHKFERPFLKLDTQGYDCEIVRAGKSVMKKFVGLQSELAVKKIYQHSIDFRAALAIYEDCGFELSAFVPNNAGHFPRLIETDCLMIRQDLIQ